MTAFEGISVSSIQKDIDWALVRKAGYRFAILRLTRGTDEVDTHAAMNLKGCLDNGILPGFYTRCFPALSGPDVQALHFARHLERVGALDIEMLPPVCDQEEQVESKAWMQDWLGHIRDLTDLRDQLFYNAGSFVDRYWGGDSWMDDDTHLWIADSGKYTGATKGQPKYQSRHTVLHHYGQSTTIPGLGGRLCDLSVSTAPILNLVE